MDKEKRSKRGGDDVFGGWMQGQLLPEDRGEEGLGLTQAVRFWALRSGDRGSR